MGWNLISTGAHHAVKSAGLEVKDVSEVTGHPECFDGRVKTFYILPSIQDCCQKRANKDDRETLNEQDIRPLTSFVNLYPFEETCDRTARRRSRIDRRLT